MDRDEIIECAKALVPWHYDFEIVEGVRTHSLNDPEDPNHTMILALDPRRIVPIIKRLYPEGLAGKDVLDIGCNAGGYRHIQRHLLSLAGSRQRSASSMRRRARDHLREHNDERQHSGELPRAEDREQDPTSFRSRWTVLDTRGARGNANHIEACGIRAI
jgi:hypothetical protein